MRIYRLVEYANILKKCNLSNRYDAVVSLLYINRLWIYEDNPRLKSFFLCSVQA